MPKLALRLLELDTVEQGEPEIILARHSATQQTVKRVKIILLASEGKIVMDCLNVH